MFTTNNNFKVFVSNANTAFPATAGVDLSAMTTGQLAILNATDQVLSLSSFPTTIATTSDALKFAMMSSNGVMSFSDKFKIKDIIAMSAREYVAPSEQVSYIGYNGTSGAINAIDYNEYILSLIYKHDDMMWSEQINIKPYLVTTESGALASTVASQFALLINKDSYSKVNASVLCSNAGAANTITAGADSTHYQFINGSNIVYGTDSNGVQMLGSDEVIATTVSGDFLRVGTAVTDDMYKIVTVINGTGSTPAGTPMYLTLDRPYAGTSQLIAIGNTEYVTAALGATSSWGLKLTGLSLDWVAKGVFPYKQVAFDVTLKGFSSTTQSTTAATYPNGYYKQVSDIEWFSQFGSDGLRNAMQHPVPTGKSDTSSSKTYNCYTIRYKTNSGNDPIVGQSNLTATIFICIASDSTTISGLSGTGANQKLSDSNGYFDVAFRTIAGLAGVSVSTDIA